MSGHSAPGSARTRPRGLRFEVLRPGRAARRSCELLAILLVPALLVAHGLALAMCLEAATVASALLGALLGILAADGLTGLVHWACDTWGDARTRWLGPHLIHSFREHHRDPGAMLRHDWLEVNREPAWMAGAALLLFSWPSVQRWLESHPALYATLCSAALYGAAANQLHCWAHADAVPAPVRWLQRRGWILSPERHARHHRAPYTGAYCISTGWLNPALDGLSFWRGFERLVTRLTGAVPRREWSQVPEQGMKRP